MRKGSNAHFVGYVNGFPIKATTPEPPKKEPKTEVEGDAPEPDQEEMPDQDWASQPTEYDPS